MTEDRGGSRPTLELIEISGLFGKFNYAIRPGEAAKPDDVRARRIILLYGDNGCGKTTILQMVWHLLSPAPSRSHRTSLARTPFRRFRLTFSNHIVIEVKKVDELIGDYTLSMRRGRESIAQVIYKVDSQMRISQKAPRDLDFKRLSRGIHRSASSKLRVRPNDDQDYLEALKREFYTPVFLAENRVIYSDDIDPDETSASRWMAGSEMAIDSTTGQIIDARRATTPEMSRVLVAKELEDSLARVTNQFQNLALGGQSSGSRSVNNLYLDFVNQLSRLAEQREETGEVDLLASVRNLGIRSKDFSALDLVPHFPDDVFGSSLDRLSGERLQIAERVLGPYFESLQARLDALQGTRDLIQTFLDEANRFLLDKEVTFSPSRGVRIKTEDGRVLQPAMLSSGERQLVLLLCNTILARERAGLFIIDEPELSLNVKWQRNLLDALLACTENSNVQFLIATHSIEMISGHRESLVRLTNVSDDE